MRRSLLLSLSAVFTVACITVSDLHAQPQVPPAKPEVPDSFEGKLVALSPTTISIQKGNDPPVKFLLSDVLASNRSPTKARWHAVPDEWSYRPCDLRIGDMVDILGQPTADGKPVCEAILIQRRPGGRVPEAPKQKFDPKHPERSWAFCANAYQDEEEKGIALPDCLIPPWEKARRAPMPREVRPVAPMPREAKP